MHSNLGVRKPADKAGWLILCCTAAIAATLLQSSFEPVAVRADSTAERRGREAFVARGCAHCHGDHRQGTARAPELITARKRLKRDAIENQISHGSQSMPAFGKILAPGELDDLIAYIRDKHEPAAAPSATP